VAKSTRVISVVGKKNSGKTTLVVALAQEWSRKGLRVGTIKHGSHPATIDAEGTDTWKCINEGHAVRALIDGPGGRALFEQADGESDPLVITRRFMSDLDIIITEGFTDSTIPKIEVFREAEHAKPRYRTDLANASSWVAIVTDGKELDVPVPQFRFSDTGLLMALTAIAWNAALVLDP
jgi:molybdopterin-guanine dinucleotide biosynthesis protein B